MAKTKTRFIVDAGGRPRSLFAVKEVPNRHDQDATDLNIHFSGGGQSRFGDLSDLVDVAPPGAYIPTETHFSVHANPHTKDTNTITRRLTLRAGNADAGSVMITTAIKSGLFAPILFRVCGDLSASRFDVPTNGDPKIQIHAFDPSRDQLRFMVSVCRRGQLFVPEEEHPSNVLQVPFQNYELILMWSYLNFPALPHAINLVPRTSRETGPMNGFGRLDLYNRYTDLNSAYSNLYFETFPNTA